jgi:protein-tyrosine-phosphatase/DnaJ-domain-containing protein 1
LRILFVSDEDRCRGPMARAVAERLARKADLEGAVFDSAGLTTTGNEGPTLEAATFMRGEKYNILNHRSKPLGPELADGADVIFCMTRMQVAEAKNRVGDYYAPKIILLNEGIDLATKRMDIEPPEGNSIQGFRRLYASLSAAMGRLVRTLEEPNVAPEFFGCRNVPKRMKPGTAGAGPRASAATIDPERRRFLSNIIFDLLERSFEPHTTSLLLDDMKGMGQELALFELEELLRQDLHNLIRQDKDGVWHVISGAREKRRDEAKARARAKAGEAREQQRSEKPAARNNGNKMTEAEAFELLGLKSDTEAGEARSKFRSLMKKYHPDKFHDDDEFRALAEEKARRINEAWNLLKERFVTAEESVGEDV